MKKNITDAWFEALPPLQRAILNRLRSLILETVPNAREEHKWGRPCYSTDNGLFCYLHSSKGYATLGFYKGANLPDPKKLLEGDGKLMRHVKLRSQANLDEPAFKAMLKKAASA